VEIQGPARVDGDCFDPEQRGRTGKRLPEFGQPCDCGHGEEGIARDGAAQLDFPDRARYYPSKQNCRLAVRRIPGFNEAQRGQHV